MQIARVRKLPARIRRERPGATHALVGPALVYDQEGVMLSLFVIIGTPGQPSRMIGVEPGDYETNPSDDPFCRLVDNALWVRQPHGITKTEGDACREELVRLLRRSFRRVEACDRDLELAEANARVFPSEKARRLLAAVRAEATHDAP
jgi:hypothetical protein